MPETTLKAAAGTPATITEFSWHVQVSDGVFTSAWSTTCNLNFDPTRPGQPGLTLPAADPTTGRVGQVGQPLTISITKPVGVTPADYQYQVNADPPDIVAADASGNATVTITPTRFTNTVTVSAQSATGNIGQGAAATFTSTPSTTITAAADLTGDGQADLLTAGGTTNLPDGLWLASGDNTGAVAATPTDIGAYGNGITGDNEPADFHSAQTITGTFTGGGLQDVLAYYPHTDIGDSNGLAVVLNANGDGSAIQANNDNAHTLSLQDLNSDANGNQLTPLQVANAGNASGQNLHIPDLISIAGDASNGYYLSYYANQADEINDYNIGLPLAVTTPGSSTDMSWNQWTIATCLTNSGGTLTTNMFLWNQTTGALWLWTNLAYDTGAGTLSYTPYVLDDGSTGHTFNKGAAVSLHAADINADATPDLWTVTGNAVTANLVSNLTSGAGIITAQTGSTTLLTGDHTWQLGDMPAAASSGDTVTTPLADSTGSTPLPATATGSATWSTGDLFSPDVDLNGSNAAMSAGKAITTNTDFTVSAWVNPQATDGTVMSEDAVNTAGFKLWAEPSDNSWRFAMPTSDVASPTWTTAAAGPGSVQISAWTHLTATYTRATGTLILYIGDVAVGSAVNTTPINAAGKIQIGDVRTSSTAHSHYLNGQIAQVQTWNRTITPGQYTSPAGYFQPLNPVRILDTRIGQGGITGPVSPNTTVKLNVRGGASPFPNDTNINAVVLNVTIVSPGSGGYLTVYPDNTPKPLASNVNYTSGQDAANLVIVPVGADGYIDIYNGGGTGTVQILADTSGYFTTNAAQAGDNTFTTIAATRYLDTRTTLGGHHNQLAAGTSLALTIGGAAGLPVPAGVTGLIVNLTATNHTAGGHLIAWADGKTRPVTSNLQSGATGSTSGTAIVPITAGNNKIDIYTNISTDLIADVVGYFLPNTNGQKYHPINAVRLIDTRQSGGPVGANAIEVLARPTTVQATAPTLITNVAATGGTLGGYINAYADNTTEPPTSSSVTYQAAQTASDLTIGPTNTANAVDYHNHSSGTVHLIIDCTGYFSTN